MKIGVSMFLTEKTGNPGAIAVPDNEQTTNRVIKRLSAGFFTTVGWSKLGRTRSIASDVPAVMNCWISARFCCCWLPVDVLAPEIAWKSWSLVMAAL